MRTKGISIKVLVDLIVTVLTYALSAGVIHLDPVLSAAIAKALGSLSAVLAPPNETAYDALPGGGAPDLKGGAPPL